jgi:hypothetical protein
MRLHNALMKTRYGNWPSETDAEIRAFIRGFAIRRQGHTKGDEVIVEQVGQVFLYNACVRKLGDIDRRWLRLSVLEAIE